MARATDPRTRPALLGAAGELFYGRGVQATSVDDIAETASLTKPTLYRHFPSKEALVAAYLNDRNERLDVDLRGWVGAAPPVHRPQAVIDWLYDWLCRPGFNGCAFVRAYAELHQDQEVHERAKERKRVLFQTIEDACRDAGATDPSLLARELTLIVEGATTMAFVSGEARVAADAARRLAGVALEAAGLEDEPWQAGDS